MNIDNSPRQPTFSETPLQSENIFRKYFFLKILLFLLSIIFIMRVYIILKSTIEPSVTVRPIISGLSVEDLDNEHIFSEQSHRLYNDPTLQDYLDKIITTDPEIISRHIPYDSYAPPNKKSMVQFLWIDPNKIYILYSMTPTGQYCAILEGLGDSCENNEIKLLNLKSNMLTPITNQNMASTNDRIMYSQKENAFLIPLQTTPSTGRHDYLIYYLNGKKRNY